MSEILLVEDDKDIRLTTIEFLEMEGFAVVGCANGQLAIDHLRTHVGPQPKLILVDLAMPVMDGAAFRAAQLADLALQAIPCVVMSANGSIDAKCRSLGIERCLKKPVDLDDLLGLVRRYVTR